MSLTVGSLFAGYGGAELGLSQVLDLEPLWFVEFDEAPSRVLAHHWPDAPNYGDITAVDWSEVERPNIITGGSPCQDLSQAGARKGMTDGTRSNLWVSMRESIAVLRPDLFVWENVRGAFSAEADSALEPCSGCLGGGGDEPSLRALGRVLGDVSDLGYDAWWYGLPASACGAAHPRFRVFVFGVPADSALNTWRLLNGNHGLSLLPTPKASNNENRSSGWANGPNLGEALALLPTPVADNSRGLPSASTDYASLANVAVSLLPTPRATVRQPQPDRWGQYAAAIARAEHVFGRPAPDPTEAGANGNPRLSPAFVEWLMGLPEGHVTDPAIWSGWTDKKGKPRTASAIRNAQLKMCGNGIVPAQIAAAFRLFWEDFTAHMTEAVAS